jgi:excisionase family DNA binding protein
MPASTQIPVLLTVQEVADLLRVHKRTIYRLVAHSEIPYRRVKAGLRFDYDELLAWTKTTADKSPHR